MIFIQQLYLDSGLRRNDKRETARINVMPVKTGIQRGNCE
jgi:hypothetical protein